MNAKIPAIPLALGLGGLIPFWALALARVLHIPAGMDPFFLGIALAIYAATILAFLGGIRWGLAVAASEGRGAKGADYVVSVIPQLLGWAALAVADPWRLLILALVLLAWGPLDRRLVARGLAPAWFGRLRIILSVGAGAALFVAALA